MARLLSLAVLALCAGAGAALATRLLPPPRPALPDPPAVAERIREVARLEALEVSLYKKVSFAPEPSPAGSLWGDLAGWARHTLRAPRGRAIVFADARLSLDLGALDATRLEVHGREAWLVLPPLQAAVELRPGETEVIGSTLDTAETAQLLERARAAFAREVEADARLRARARGAAERAIRALLVGLGFEAVHFVERLPGGATS
jgi:hypothetical protein